jgi:ADP-heptose:LPS heptosyltransferase/SAM-dependent methyltransferase
MAWSIDGPQGFESRKIKYLLPRYTRGRGLEIGCGMEKAFPHFIGVDNGHHFGRGAADVVCNADDLGIFADESMDFVFSSHVLEHMEDMQKALDEWSRVIKPGGYLCLYVPSANLYPKCGEFGANPDHKHDIYPLDIITMLDDSPYWFQQVECSERGQDNEYSLFEVYKKLEIVEGSPDNYVTVVTSDYDYGRPKPKQSIQKTACICRFGGFGDMIQTALLFPRFKELGYHVTVMTTPKGQDIIRHDPNVDDWYIVDQEQIPNHELHAFWAEQAKRFDRFVNLSESIEGTLLALPGRPNHSWPHEVRKKRLNLNYHEWTAELAGVPFKPCQLFYATPEEVEAVNAIKRLSGEAVAAVSGLQSPVSGLFTVLWALSGSSLHKFTPHQDSVIARILLDMPEARVILVGDLACQVLEQGWENEPRVVCLSDKLSIRQSLALAQQVDLVIGPETGVLNAVGMDKTPHKVLLLSHSSANNLSKHWENTQALAPVGCDCYPCHRLHYSTEYCDQDEYTGAARCALNIKPDVIYAAAEKVYKTWKRKQKWGF